MAYVGFARWKPILPGWSLPIVLLALFTYALLRFNFHQTAWAFCLLVGLALPLFRQIRSRACVIASRQIAKYSYGIYLTHPFAIVIGLYLLRGHGMVVRFAAMLGPLILLPLLAYHLIEHPMIRLGSRLAAMIETKYERREMKATFQQPVA
jgi:peptidoglycan/LPS O-acetylase OafA/YrhL